MSLARCPHHRPGGRADRARSLGAAGVRPQARLDRGNACARRSHHKRGPARGACGREDRGPGRLRHHHCGGPAQGRRLAAFGAEKINAMHTPGHTAGSMSYLWRDHVFTGDTLLITAAGAPTFSPAAPRRCIEASPNPVRAPRCHDRLARARLPGPDAHDHRRREGGEPEDRGQDQAEFVAIMDKLGLPKPKLSTKPCRRTSHRACGTTRAAARARSAPRGGLCRRCFAAARLQMVARRRCRPGRRADRRRARVGGIHSRRRSARVERVAGHDDERCVRRRLHAAVPKGKKSSCSAGAACAHCRREAGNRARARGLQLLEGFEGDPDERAQRGARAAGAVTACPGGRASSGLALSLHTGGASDRVKSFRAPDIRDEYRNAAGDAHGVVPLPRLPGSPFVRK